MSFEAARQRLFDFSFDPYQCPERRWGATSVEELATCPDGALKQAWYKAERRLRNQLDRTYDVKMGFTLSDLQNGVPNSGQDNSPDVDVLATLMSLQTTGSLAVEGVRQSLPSEVVPEREAN